MNKQKLFLIVALIFASLLFGGAAYAEGTSDVDLSKLENLSKKLQQESDYLPDINFSNLIDTYKKTGSIGVTLKDFSGSIVKFIFKEIVGSSKLLVELLFVSLFCAVLKNIQSTFENKQVADIAYYACFLMMVIIIIKSFAVAIQVGRETIDMMIEFTNALMPTLIVLLAAVGGFTSAATLDPVVLFVIKVTSDIIRDFVLPGTILVVIINIVDNISEHIKISSLGKLVKQASVWVLGFIVTVFVGVVTVRSSAAATLDQVTLKTAKFAVDNFIPVIGKTLSDAFATVAGYSMILKDAVSIAGLVIMVFICAFPLIKILIIGLIYKFVGAVMEPVVDKRVIGCLNAAGSSMTIVFACVLSVAVMFFIMITVVASTGRLVMMVR